MNSKMYFYVLKRFLLAILTIWIVITVTFFVMHSVPGGPFVGEKAISKGAQAALEAKYGLDKPLMTQYVTYLRDIVTRFDFGPSLKQRGRQVVSIIADGMRTSARLGIIAAVIATFLGILLGAVAALRRNTLPLKREERKREGGPGMCQSEPLEMGSSQNWILGRCECLHWVKPSITHVHCTLNSSFRTCQQL